MHGTQVGPGDDSSRPARSEARCDRRGIASPRPGSALRPGGDEEPGLRAVGSANQIVIRSVRFDSLAGAGQSLSVFSARLCGIAVGGYTVAKGQITLGTLVAFLSDMGGLFAPAQRLTGIYRTLRTAFASLDQVFKILDTPDAVCPEPVRGHVVFDHVDFAYQLKGNAVGGTLSRRIVGTSRLPYRTFCRPSAAGRNTIFYFPAEGGRLIVR